MPTSLRCGALRETFEVLLRGVSARDMLLSMLSDKTSLDALYDKVVG